MPRDVLFLRLLRNIGEAFVLLLPVSYIMTLVGVSQALCQCQFMRTPRRAVFGAATYFTVLVNLVDGLDGMEHVTLSRPFAVGCGDKETVQIAHVIEPAKIKCLLGIRPTEKTPAKTVVMSIVICSQPWVSMTSYQPALYLPAG